MNAIEMYDVLKHIPNVSDEQARSMADTMAKIDSEELLTKPLLKADLKEFGDRMLKWQIVIASIIIAGMAVLNFLTYRFI